MEKSAPVIIAVTPGLTVLSAREGNCTNTTGGGKLRACQGEDRRTGDSQSTNSPQIPS